MAVRGSPTPICGKNHCARSRGRIFPGTSAFVNFDFGYASALAWVLFAFIFVATLIQLWYMRRNLGRTYGA